jgi:acyl-CoA thioester hydrolase
VTLPFRTDIQVRFNDTDLLGHLNNASYAAYAEQARVTFFRHVAPESGLILAHIALDFRRQAAFGEEVYVLTGVEKLGRSSITLIQDIYASEHVAAHVRSVVVFFDYQRQKPTALPAALRAQLAAVATAGARPDSR